MRGWQQTTRNNTYSYICGFLSLRHCALNGTRFYFLMAGENTFSKRERLCSGKLTDRLFSEGNRQISVFPVRLVWLLTDESEGVRILISAPKRNFHNAVDRNRIKRQIREFYRTSSATLKETVAARNKGLVLAFLFNDTHLWDTCKLVPRLRSAMERLVETLSVNSSGNNEEREG